MPLPTHPAHGAPLSTERPFTDMPFTELPPGAVRPLGWLREQLELQACGLSGQLENLWPAVGPTSGWLGGGGERGEQGPYYLDGLLPLAYILNDATLIGRAHKWTEAILSSQRPDGNFGPADVLDWWPRMVVLKVMIQHAEASGDSRVEPFLRRYFEYQRRELPLRPLSDWGQARGAENALAALWLHARSGEGWLRDLAASIVEQTLDWATYLGEQLPGGPATRFEHRTHVVNVAMGLTYFAAQHLLGVPGRPARLAQALEQLDLKHGMVNGMFSGDEWLAGLEPQRGVETCAVVEAMHSLEVLARLFGDGALADRLEVITFNALPAAMSADMRSHQYHQQVNQVSCTVERRNWTYSTDDANIFGLEPRFGCCTANLHQGWPKFVRSLWARSQGGLVALGYAPNTLDTEVGGHRVRMETLTDYPFGDTLTLRVLEAGGARFSLRLRIPGWCVGASLSLGGQAQACTPDSAGFVQLERIWTAGDVLELRLPMPVRVLPRPNAAVSFRSGPLTLAFSPGERWSLLPDSAGFGDWELRPRHSWNYGVALQGTDIAALEVQRFGPTSPPFTVRPGPPPLGAEGVPLKVQVPGHLLPSWGFEPGFASAAAPAPGPLTSRMPPAQLSLVPYGCARIRIAEFPTVRAE